MLISLITQTEPLPAYVTFVTFFACMLMHVHLQLKPSSALFPANIATETEVVRMEEHMGGQSAAGSVTFTANIADVRSLAAVNDHMIPQVYFSGEFAFT